MTDRGTVTHVPGLECYLCPRLLSPRSRVVAFVGPVAPEGALLDPVSVEAIMNGHVATHKVQRVPGVGGMDGRSEPCLGGKFPQSGHELPSSQGETGQGGLQVHPQEAVFRLVCRLIGHDRRAVLREDTLKANRPYRFHHGQMAEVLMS